MRIEPTVRVAFFIACATLLGGAIAFRAVAATVNAWVLKEPAPPREPFSTIPTTLGVWKAVTSDTMLSEEMVEALGTNIYLDRVYAIDGNPKKGLLQLHMAYYTGLIDRVPHVPERCFVAGGFEPIGSSQVRALAIDDEGWRPDNGPVNVATGIPYAFATVVDPISRRASDVRMPIGEPEITVVEFQDPAKPDRRLIAGYFFIANGRLTPRAGDVRALSYSLTERYAYFCKVQITRQYFEEDGRVDDYDAHVSDFLKELLPHLMHRLPDWSEYEARSRAPDPSG